MNQDRRKLLGAGAALSAAALIGEARAQSTGDPVDLSPPEPGKPGDFDFLAGEWRIKHRRLPPGAKEWDVFEGEATCWTILAGVGSVEELRIPARNFSGMGLRLLDMTKNVWADHWVNSKSGVMTAPGQTGGFRNGAGVFWSDDMDGDKPIKVAGVWDRITPRACRWRQTVSRDGGKSWEDNWVMEWTKV